MSRRYNPGDVINGRRLLERNSNSRWSYECIDCGDTKRDAQISALKIHQRGCCAKGKPGDVVNGRRLLIKNYGRGGEWQYECVTCGRLGKSSVTHLRSHSCQTCSRHQPGEEINGRKLLERNANGTWHYECIACGRKGKGTGVAELSRTSCIGCPRFNPHIGKIFNNRRIVGIAKKTKHGANLYNWVCIEHGVGTKPALIEQIKNTKPLCCRYIRYGDFTGHLYAGIRQGAIARGLDFFVSHEYLWTLYLDQGGQCAYTGKKIVFQRGDNAASLDRIDSSAGYIEGNVEWVNKHVNMAKQRLSKGLFIQLCKEVAANT